MRCPVCRADNTEGPGCRRCRADLTLLFQLEEQQARLLSAVRAAIRSQRWSEALQLAEQAHTLHRNQDSWQLLALCQLVLRQFPAAWRSYQAQRN